MPRYRAPGGWTVEVIRLEGTSGNRDGEWLRVSLHGSWVADVRTVGEIERYVSLEQLVEDGLAPAVSARARLAHSPHKLGDRPDDECGIISLHVVPGMRSYHMDAVGRQRCKLELQLYPPQVEPAAAALAPPTIRTAGVAFAGRDDREWQAAAWRPRSFLVLEFRAD